MCVCVLTSAASPIIGYLRTRSFTRGFHATETRQMPSSTSARAVFFLSLSPSNLSLSRSVFNHSVSFYLARSLSVLPVFDVCNIYYNIIPFRPSAVCISDLSITNRWCSVSIFSLGFGTTVGVLPPRPDEEQESCKTLHNDIVEQYIDVLFYYLNCTELLA